MKVIYIENQKIKGVAEQSSVFASEIFTAISQIPAEESPELIHINEMHEMPWNCLLYTSPSPRDKRQSRMPSSA